MKARNVTRQEMETALLMVNKMYDGNVIFNRFDNDGNGFIFTLRVKDSKGKGARKGFSGKRMTSACWHVHGNFFECLFKVCPTARIFSSGIGWIDIEGGNWQDRNIGSPANPLYYSDACFCK